MHFQISDWRAWAPGLGDQDAWRQWCAAPWRPADDGSQPDASFLPAMQRRRLSRLARMTFQVAWPLADAHGDPLPLIFASRHGETPRTLAILQELARGEPLSPTQFSLSVHNAIIGQWSILRGDHSEMNALATGRDGLEHAVLEACTLLAEGASGVLVVIAEEAPPTLYAPQIDDVPFPYAVGLLLTPGGSHGLSGVPAPAEAAPSAWPHALELLRLLEAPGALHLAYAGRAWHWQAEARG